MPIALPVGRIGANLGVHWTRIVQMRREAVKSGLLKVVEPCIPHRRAATYRWVP